MIQIKFNILKKGIVKLEVRTINLEKFINLLWKNNVRVKNINKINISTIILEIEYSSYSTVKNIAKRTEAKITIIGKEGLIFKIFKFKKQFSILLGIGIFLIILYVLSSFLWRIEIDTQNYVSPFEIRQQLKNFGITQGIRKKSINVYDLEKKIESVNPDVMWIKIRIEGSTLKVLIEEKVNPPNSNNNENKNSIVAKMDGEVVKVYTKSGTPIVKVGDIVKKGQVLIDGVEGKEGFEYKVKADGKIIANTFYEKSAMLQVSGDVLNRTGKKQEELYLNILGKKIYLKKIEKNFQYYDKIEKKGKIINKEIFYEKQNTKITESEDDIIEKKVKELYDETIKNIENQGEIIDKIIKPQKINNNTVKLDVIFIVQQDICLKN